MRAESRLETEHDGHSVPLLQTTTPKRRERENKLECPATEVGWGGGDGIGGWEGYWVHWWWRMDTGGGMGSRTLHEGKTSTKMCESVIVPSL